jgi:hypothetical protein
MRSKIVVVACALGCSARVSPISALDSSESDDAAIDTAYDVPDLPNEVHCGPPPWMPHSWQWSTSYGAKMRVAGMRAHVDVCPDKVATTGADGKLTLYVHEGMQYSVLVDAPDRRDPTAHGEYHAIVPLPETWYLLQPKPDVPLVRELFDLSKGGIGPVPYLDRWPAPCDDYDGTSFYVEGHPEAKVHYLDSHGAEVEGPVPKGGSVFIDGLAPGLHVVVKASKPGCRVTTYDPNFPLIDTTGLHPGYVSYVRFDIEPPDADAGTD